MRVAWMSAWLDDWMATPVLGSSPFHRVLFHSSTHPFILVFYSCGPWRGRVTVKVVPVGPASGSVFEVKVMSPRCILTMP